MSFLNDILSTDLLIVVAQNAPAKPPQFLQFLPFALIGVLFYFMLLRPERQRRATHEKMLSELKKNDRVVTSGGIFGTIVNAQDDEVVLKIDESSNTRIRVTRNSITRKVSNEPSESS